MSVKPYCDLTLISQSQCLERDYKIMQVYYIFTNKNNENSIMF